MKASRQLLEPIYRSGYRYTRRACAPTDIRLSRPHQESLFGRGRKEDEDLMEAVDPINREHEKRAVRFGAAGLPGGEGNLRRDWTMRRQKRSLRYTTGWDELSVAQA